MVLCQSGLEGTGGRGGEAINENDWLRIGAELAQTASKDKIFQKVCMKILISYNWSYNVKFKKTLKNLTFSSDALLAGVVVVVVVVGVGFEDVMIFTKLS